MRTRVIEALTFPRYQMLADLDRDNCTHSGFYARGDRKCRECDFGLECEWLYDNEEFGVVQRRPMRILVEALEFAINYIDAQVVEWEHDSERCACDACTWLRDARRLFAEAYHSLD